MKRESPVGRKIAERFVTYKGRKRGRRKGRQM